MNSTIICNFKVFLQEQNYSEGTIAGYVRAVKDLKDPPEEDGTSAMIDYIDDVLSVKSESLSKSSFANACTALNRLFLWITGTELKAARKQESILNDEDPLILQYRDYCTSFLHLTPAVTDAASREVKLFLSCMSGYHADLEWSTITAEDVVSFLSDNRSELRISSLGVTATAIRRFFRFLQHQGIGVHSSILVLPLSIPDWSKGGSLPKVLSEQDFAHRSLDTILFHLPNDINHLEFFLLLQELNYLFYSILHHMHPIIPSACSFSNPILTRNPHIYFLFVWIFKDGVKLCSKIIINIICCYLS